ncbi:phthalate transporter [Coprinopsis cinerea okayama7|uniref:Phthalate transporter n=1 Tax=Coprinopsis cinerea (strain Okayama-7 / 130 / ATCC MYA-4618 / FGSC 9003) TaxID=240176 RepID=A8N7S2_COPC7|nr:phthalate transporter [Coprinopsis cinerea okayama7\|eukprot:XP_001830878.1 phthalate transporter [Coprinopsis cinerea okayama7\
MGSISDKMTTLDVNGPPPFGSAATSDTHLPHPEKLAVEPTKIDDEAPFDLESVTEAERKKVLRKMDWKLLPFISFLYLLSFLDRANIGNAKIAGMAHDLKLDGLKYNVIAAVFFIPYALAEVPSNVCLKLFRPSRWIPSIMVAWGLVMTLMCLCKTYEGLIVARVFLGLTEAGLFPGITFYLSLWYRRKDMSQRIAIFFSAATIAGAFGGLLAYAIEHMEGIGGLYGWQWIFCLEGMATVVFAFLSYFFMYDCPEDASFLTPRERKIVVTMLKEDKQGLATDFKMDYVWQAMKDRKTYLQVGIYTGLLVPVYAISLFTPTIVNELGFDAAVSQLLTVPPFFCGCVATLIIGILSDKYHKRGPFVVVGCSISLIGYIILISQNTVAGSYVGAVLAATGVYPCVPVTLAWAGSNSGGDMRRGVALAMVIGFGNLGGICSSFIYIKPPRFFLGHGMIIGWLCLAIMFACAAMYDYKRQNALNKARCEAEGIDESREAEFVHLGNDSPLFHYTI